MTRIISIPSHSRQDNEKPSVHECWLLSYNAFWLHDRLPIKEVSDAQKNICNYLGQYPAKDGFIQFCERILLAHKMMKTDISQWVDLPSLWFNPQFQDGFLNSANTYKSVMEKRKVIKGYQKGINVFARNYLKYSQSPSDELLGFVRDKLLILKEYDLLQLWNNTIIHLHIGKSTKSRK